MNSVPPLYPILYDDLVRATLREDLGAAGDLTSDAVIPSGQRARTVIAARQDGRIAGLDIAIHAFRTLDPDVSVTIALPDGSDAPAGATLATINGLARPMLSAERTALNLLGRLCGVSTATRTLVRLVEGTGAAIACTRKTTPGLRTLEKYAVRVGGGMNHRFGLDDAVLMKDNHIAAVGNLTDAVARVRGSVGHLVKIQVEVDTLEQLAELLKTRADAVLLDNFSPPALREAVRMIDGRMIIEASGGITRDTIRSVAETGVDLISVGALTHSASVLDVGLDFALT